MQTANKRETGEKGENVALGYLLSKGYGLVQRHYRTYFGEIDLIMKTPEQVLVFVEVKMACTYGSGEPEYHVTRKKQRQLGRMAMAYFQQMDILDQECRFDVMAIDNVYGSIEIRHYENAFML